MAMPTWPQVNRRVLVYEASLTFRNNTMTQNIPIPFFLQTKSRPRQSLHSRGRMRGYLACCQPPVKHPILGRLLSGAGQLFCAVDKISRTLTILTILMAEYMKTTSISMTNHLWGRYDPESHRRLTSVATE